MAVVSVVDLFAGPGGLGEGFASFQTARGQRPFRIGLSVEREYHAHRTLRLRSFFRQYVTRGVSASEAWRRFGNEVGPLVKTAP